MEKNKNLNGKFTDDEIDDILEHLAGTTGDLPKTMEETYKELMSLGLEIKKENEYVMDVFLFNLELCMRYNLNIEDYRSLSDLHKLYNQIKL